MTKRGKEIGPVRDPVVHAAAKPGVKRAFDVALALFAAVAVTPVLAIAVGVILLIDGPPVFYESVRVGAGGCTFRLIKLRTMRRDADQDLRGSVTDKDDPRVTPLGRVLRHWKIDELPQIFNVLAGEMSFVGPRPDTPEYAALYSSEQKEVYRYLPGITSPASIRFVNEAELLAESEDPRATYLEEIMPEQIHMDLEYMRTATIWSDIVVIVGTAKAILGEVRGD